VLGLQRIFWVLLRTIPASPRVLNVGLVGEDNADDQKYKLASDAVVQWIQNKCSWAVRKASEASCEIALNWLTLAGGMSTTSEHQHGYIKRRMDIAMIANHFVRVARRIELSSERTAAWMWYSGPCQSGLIMVAEAWAIITVPWRYEAGFILSIGVFNALLKLRTMITYSMEMDDWHGRLQQKGSNTMNDIAYDDGQLIVQPDEVPRRLRAEVDERLHAASKSIDSLRCSTRIFAAQIAFALCALCGQIAFALDYI